MKEYDRMPGRLRLVAGVATITLPNPKRAAEGEQSLASSFATIQRVWLKSDAKFLLSNDVADLYLVSEIMQIRMLGDEDRNGLIGMYEKVQEWIENVKNATNPHFDEVHQYLFDVNIYLKLLLPSGKRP
ncbi:glutathione S-transferase T1-like [Silene latifolia]|uniref:glutathione S-transferase T1-like n=1 Tax=Silene latifolia TaxID=37657 RepID=UPI003D773AC1